MWNENRCSYTVLTSISSRHIYIYSKELCLTLMNVCAFTRFTTRSLHLTVEQARCNRVLCFSKILKQYRYIYIYIYNDVTNQWNKIDNLTKAVFIMFHTHIYTHSLTHTLVSYVASNVCFFLFIIIINTHLRYFQIFILILSLTIFLLYLTKYHKM